MSLNHRAGIHVHVGASGSGKTRGLLEKLYRFARDDGGVKGKPVIIIDRMREVESIPNDLLPLTAYKNIDTIDKAADCINKGARIAIVRGDIDDLTLADQACAWAKSYKGLTGIFVPEAHNEMPNSMRVLPTHIQHVATAWRHYEVALFLDSQRFALLNTSVRDLARELRLYAMNGKSDLAACDDIAPELRPLVLEAARRLDEEGPNEPGWHVRLGLSRTPPYRLTRDL